MENFNPADIEFFKVRKAPAITTDFEDPTKTIILPNKQHIMVENNAIYTSSMKYEIHQPQDVFQKFADVAAKTGLTIKNLLLNPANGGMLVEAFYENTNFVGEEHDVNIVFHVSHSGQYKTFIALNVLRQKCMNQVPVLSKERGVHLFSEKHYNNALDLTMFQRTLEEIPQAVQNYSARVENLLDGKLSYEDFAEFYIAQMKIKRESKGFDRVMLNLKDVYHGADGQKSLANDTGYKAMQAITYIATHQGRATKFANERVFLKGRDDTIKAIAALEKIAA